MPTETKQADHYLIRLKGTAIPCRFDSYDEAVARFEWHQTPCRMIVVFTDGTSQVLHSTI